MTAGFLARQLKPDTIIIIKQSNGKVLFEGAALYGNSHMKCFGKKVKDWDFSKAHVIFVE